MKLSRLHEICNKKGYQYKYENDITTFIGATDISFRIKIIPGNLVFKNKGSIKLELIKKLPETITFLNKGSVTIGPETVIPENYKGFRQKGGLLPENYKYRLPIINYQFSEEFAFFLQDNIKNKYVAKLSKLNGTSVDPEGFDGSFIDCVGEDITFIPTKNIHKKYKAVVEKEKEAREAAILIEKEKAEKLAAKEAKLAAKAEKEKAERAAAIAAGEPVAPKKAVKKAAKKAVPAPNYNNYNNNLYNNIQNYFAANKHQLFKEGGKNKIKIGRFIKKIFPNMVDGEVEEFVNLFKAFKNGTQCGLEIVRGEDIVKYYNRNNQVTPINGSCMNYSEESDIKFKNLHFYANIPNCGLLVLRDKDADGNVSDKIRARALIWDGIDNRQFVDYIYTTRQSDVYIYKRYIAINKCLSATNGDAIRDFTVACPEEVKNLKHYMPYLDSLKYDKNTNLVTGNKY